MLEDIDLDLKEVEKFLQDGGDMEDLIISVFIEYGYDPETAFEMAKSYFL